MKSQKPFLSVILPTYKESLNIEEMAKRCYASIKKAGCDGEVIVVDDDSPDMTWKIVQDMNRKGIYSIRRIKEKGLASAIKCGIKKAKGDIVIWMDADLSMPPELIPKMVSPIIKNNADITVGSRYAKGGKDKRNFVRVITSIMINLFTNIVLNFKVRDYDSGYIASRKNVFYDIPLSSKGHGEYCIEFLYKAGRLGYRIKEIGYVFVDRVQGESKTGEYLKDILKYGFVYVGRVIHTRLNSMKKGE